MATETKYCGVIPARKLAFVVAVADAFFCVLAICSFSSNSMPIHTLASLVYLMALFSLLLGHCFRDSYLYTLPIIFNILLFLGTSICMGFLLGLLAFADRASQAAGAMNAMAIYSGTMFHDALSHYKLEVTESNAPLVVMVCFSMLFIFNLVTMFLIELYIDAATDCNLKRIPRTVAEQSGLKNIEQLP